MLNVSGVSKIQGGETLYQNVNFQVYPGEKVGLVGPNGAGKTTLFRMIIGEEKPDQGQISFPDKATLSYFSQSVGEMHGSSALELVIGADKKIKVLQQQLTQLEQKVCDPDLSDTQMQKLLEQMGDVQTEFEKRGGYDLESRASEVLTGLGIHPVDHHKLIENFSGGQKMRVALAAVLVMKPDLIVMDEPTNYLDMETILWLEEWLKSFEGAILMTTHDRYFMNNVCKKIVELAYGTAQTYSGDFSFYEKERQVRLNQIKAEHKKQQESIAKDEEFIAKFKARASHAAQVQSRVKKLEKVQRVILPEEQKTIHFEFSHPPRGGDDVVIIENLSKSWPKEDGEHQVFSGLSTVIKRLDKIAVVGINGAGKSTLLKCITGQTKPSQGVVSLGPSIKCGYFSQYSLDVLKPSLTVLEQVRAVLKDASDGYLRNLLAAFQFRGDDVHKKTKHLSGGEKSRLVLATLLSQNCNLLVLDEPTNHLDIASREVLMQALQKFDGTVIFVSHDRFFLEAVAQKVFEVDKQQIVIYPGDYKYYQQKVKV